MIVDMGGIGRGGEWKTVNLDGNIRSAPDIYADITDAQQLSGYFRPNSIDQMRSVHTVEHLHAHKIIPTLKIWHNLLKPGGKLCIVVPDIETMINDYKDGAISFDVLISVAYTPPSTQARGALECHHWGFSYYTLVRAMVEAGFQNLNRGDASDWVSAWIYDYQDFRSDPAYMSYMVPNLIVVGYK